MIRSSGTLGLALAFVVSHVALGVMAADRHWVDSVVAGVLEPRSDALRVLLGGRERSLVVDGAWWRLASTGIVHVDPLHLLLNTLAVIVIGRVVEPHLGPWRVAAVVCLGVVAGAALAQVSGVVRADGASGGVFALVGCGVAVGLRRPDLPADERGTLVKGLGGLGVLNLLASLVVPALDVASHAGGLAAGFVAGLLLARSSADRPWALVVVAWAGVVVAGLAGVLDAA